MSDEADFEKLPINKVRQVANRGHYDRETVYRLLDQNLMGQVGFVSDAKPVIIPMLFARHEDVLYFHGSTKSRLMKQLCSGEPICVSATNMDGLVLAKSLFHHSMNYRSVCVFGKGQEVTDPEERMNALRIITDKVMPNRWDDARRPNAQEMKATCIAAVEIESASAKIRTGGPNDDQADMSLPVWSGTIPIAQQALSPVEASGDSDSPNPNQLEMPIYIDQWFRQFNKESIEVCRL